MKIFVTGASGYIGRHLIISLLNKNHFVTGLSRHWQASNHPQLTWFTGGLEELEFDSLNAYDVVVHLAMNYVRNDENKTLEKDIVYKLSQLNTHIIYTGNLFDTENSSLPIREVIYPDSTCFRAQMENKLSIKNEALAVIRPGFVYGGDSGYLWELFSKQKVTFLASSQSEQVNGLWPMIHITDLVSLYVHVLENKLKGVFHGFDGIPIPVSKIIETLYNVYECNCMTINQINSFDTGSIDSVLMDKSIEVENKHSIRSGWQLKRSNFLLHAFNAYEDYKNGSYYHESNC